MARHIQIHRSAHKNAITEPVQRSCAVWLVCLLLIVLALPSSSISEVNQGSIFGSVTDSEAGVPADSDISFVGFLNETDNEIRLETCTGAGYESGFWLDDFQNFLEEAPGLPYRYNFYDAATGEGFSLTEVIPDNSFQKEDVVLGPIAWPAIPATVRAGFEGDHVTIVWTQAPGLHYRIYRRVVPSSGSFFRIDVPPGSTSDLGVYDSVFSDTVVDTLMAYDYVVVAADSSGQLGPHSDIMAVSPEISCCAVAGDVNHDGEGPDIADLVYLATWMFQPPSPAPPCEYPEGSGNYPEADVSGDGIGADISDLVYIVNWMFHPPSPAPVPCP